MGMVRNASRILLISSPWLVLVLVWCSVFGLMAISRNLSNEREKIESSRKELLFPALEPLNNGVMKNRYYRPVYPKKSGRVAGTERENEHLF